METFEEFKVFAREKYKEFDSDLEKYTLEENCSSDMEYPESVKKNIDYVLSYLSYYDFSEHRAKDIEGSPSEKAVVDAFDDLGRIIGIDYILK